MALKWHKIAIQTRSPPSLQEHPIMKLYTTSLTFSARPREPLNKSRQFSAGNKAASYAKDSAVNGRVLCKLADKVDGRFSARPSGRSEQCSSGINEFRRATGPPVFIA
ncbi:hypothetical protein [uncultured Pseudoteredinibacter sp.]|uniref:hypothetical protein n=1 Tax=uncultured Pseudoteredinibacter sp. TaxID=1641701 RepID=UPI002635D73B|nr:hypothetical protein [uncultured Pseudoteredinibacter sp.]